MNSKADSVDPHFSRLVGEARSKESELMFVVKLSERELTVSLGLAFKEVPLAIIFFPFTEDASFLIGWTAGLELVPLLRLDLKDMGLSSPKLLLFMPE